MFKAAKMATTHLRQAIQGLTTFDLLEAKLARAKSLAAHRKAQLLEQSLTLATIQRENKTLGSKISGWFKDGKISKAPWKGLAWPAVLPSFLEFFKPFHFRSRPSAAYRRALEDFNCEFTVNGKACFP